MKRQKKYNKIIKKMEKQPSAEVNRILDTIKIAKGVTLPMNLEKSQFIPEAKDYKNTNHILEQVSIAVNKNLPVLLMGETGTGKTSLVRYLAAKTNNGYRRVNHNGGTTVDDIKGRTLVNKAGTYWQDGTLIQAMRSGHWFLADEINASSADILFLYHSLLDDDGYIVLDEKDGEVVRPHKNFRFFGTMNPALDYHGVKELNKALMSRFVCVKTDFPSPNIEKQILMERTGVSAEVANNMVKLAAEIRAGYAKGNFEYVMSTRDLILWATMYSVYGKYIVSAEMTVLNKVNQDNFEAIKDKIALNLDPFDNPSKYAKKDDNKKAAIGSNNFDPYVARADGSITNAPF